MDQINYAWRRGRRTLSTITIDGVTKSAGEWAETEGVTVTRGTIFDRIATGRYSPKQAVFKQKGRYIRARNTPENNPINSVNNEIREIAFGAWL